MGKSDTQAPGSWLLAPGSGLQAPGSGALGCRPGLLVALYNGRVRLRIAVVLLAVGAATMPVGAAFVERWYSAGLYPRVQRVLTPLSNLVPVAWFDLLSVAAVAWLIWTWWRAARRRDEPVSRRLGRAAVATVVAAAVVYLTFLALWGLNYRRLPMTTRLVVKATAPSATDVLTLGQEAAARLNGLYAPARMAGWHEPVWQTPALRQAFGDVQRQLTDAPLAAPGRLKRTLFGPFFRWTSVDGMINPFGLEALANPDLLPFERPFVAAHEWAHLAGFADESEANFVGWLTCVRADEPSEYSGWLYLYWQIAGELPRSEQEELGGALAEGPRRDLASIAARLRQGDVPMLRRASWKMYDQYLKANRVQAGVRSYGAVVTLILQARFEDGWRPVRRPSASAP